ncbi:MAG: hypothetical protein GX613_17330 [Chloroflexi bacterium]|nr:hypothetical protein [Chloroflexota bacterium]
MAISGDARNVIGWLFVTVPLVEYGGYFLLSLLRRRGTEASADDRFSFYRAGHAHAGVLVILAIIAQIVIDQAGFSPSVASLVCAGFFLPPILMSAGFFLGAPDASGRPRRLVALVYVGAVVLLLASWALGFTLVFGNEPAAAMTG